MNAIIDQFDEATKREQALADEKIRKYTQKYKNDVRTSDVAERLRR